MPFNPYAPGTRLSFETSAISLNTSGIVGISVDMRVPKKAWANYSAHGSTSGQAEPHVIGVSGNVVDVQFRYNTSGLRSGTDIGVLQIADSGIGFSGGTLTVLVEGDL